MLSANTTSDHKFLKKVIVEINMLGVLLRDWIGAYKDDTLVVTKNKRAICSEDMLVTKKVV